MQQCKLLYNTECPFLQLAPDCESLKWTATIFDHWYCVRRMWPLRNVYLSMPIKCLVIKSLFNGPSFPQSQRYFISFSTARLYCPAWQFYGSWPNVRYAFLKAQLSNEMGIVLSAEKLKYVSYVLLLAKLLLWVVEILIRNVYWHTRCENSALLYD